MLDFNDLERHARRLIDVGRFADAIAIYLFMGDDDPSQDAGYLAWRVGQCREAIGELHAAKRWYGIALGENPGVEKYQDALRRLEGVGVDTLPSADECQRDLFRSLQSGHCPILTDLIHYEQDVCVA